MAEDDVAISIEHVGKTFRLPHEKQTSLKGLFLSSFRHKSYELQRALDDVNFEVKKGEFFGIVGRNGSGKSTLLKCIAGVYSPSKGQIKVNGSLVPFIELGVGFNPELTGRDNVFLNGALLGFSRRQMEKMYDDIVEFAELEKFMDQKLKNYSSGMQVRLAFSIAIRAQADILLLDEVLAVGDSSFQQKCFDYFAELKRSNKTVILVTHSMPMVERFCDRALLLDNGMIVNSGKSSKIASLYEDMFLAEENKRSAPKTEESPEGQAHSPIKADVNVLQNQKKVRAVKALEKFEIEITVASEIDIEDANIGINIKDDQDRIVFSSDVKRVAGAFSLRKAKLFHAVFEIENFYTNGRYSIDLHVVNEGGGANKLLFRHRGVQKFSIMGIVDHAHSLFHPKFRVRVS